MTLYPTATTRAGANRQVFEGRAERTRGGLKKKDLKVSKSGKIVSRRASRASKRKYAKNGLARYRGQLLPELA
jgi:hypothetical protein